MFLKEVKSVEFKNTEETVPKNRVEQKEIKAVDFKYATDVVSEEQFNAHTKLYNGYVKKLNEVDAILQGDGMRSEANAIYSYYRGLKKGVTFSLDSVILHELYFSNISYYGQSPGEKTTAFLAESFGSYEAFLKDFTATCMSARGWCLTVYDQRSERLRNILCDAHDEGIILGSYPIIVTDMYEHAYFYDYLTDKEAYINSVIRGLNWEAIESRAARLQRS